VIPGRKYTPEEVLTIGWRRKWLLALPVVLVTAASAAYAVWLPNKYRCETLVLVVPQRVPESYVRSTVTSRIEDRLRSLSSQIMSRTKLERIIQDFNLYDWKRGTVAMEDIVEGMRNEIDVEPLRGDAFTLSYQSHDPQLAMKVTQRLATLFIDENLQDRTVMAESTSQFLESQLEDTRSRLVDNEKKLEAFRRRHSGKLPEQMEANLQVLQSSQLQLQNIVDSINRDRDRRMLVERQIADLQVPIPSPTPAPPVISADDPTVITGGTAAQQLTMYREQLQAMEQRFKPEHPDVRNMRRTIADLESKVAAETPAEPATAAAAPTVAAPVVSTSVEETQRLSRLRELRTERDNIDRAILQGQREETRLREFIGDYQTRVEAVPGLQSELTSLMRDYDTVQEQYKNLLSKQGESKIAANLERRSGGEQFRVLDPARVPERPYSPNRRMILMVGFLLGLGMGVGLVALMEYRDRSLRTDADVMAVLALPVLASIPVITTSAERMRRRQQRLLMSATGAALLLVGGIVVWKLLPWQRALERIW